MRLRLWVCPRAVHGARVVRPGIAESGSPTPDGSALRPRVGRVQLLYAAAFAWFATNEFLGGGGEFFHRRFQSKVGIRLPTLTGKS